MQVQLDEQVAGTEADTDASIDAKVAGTNTDAPPGARRDEPAQAQHVSQGGRACPVADIRYKRFGFEACLDPKARTGISGMHVSMSVFVCARLCTPSCVVRVCLMQRNARTISNIRQQQAPLPTEL